MRNLRQARSVIGSLLPAFLLSISYATAQDISPTLTTIHAFAGAPGDGAFSAAAVTVGSDGVLYGTAAAGGTSNLGTVFSLTPSGSPGGSWTLTVLYNFAGGSDGASPDGPVTIGSAGVLYGVTGEGGPNHSGTVYALTPPGSPGGPWTEAVLCSFGAGRADGSEPVGPLAFDGSGVLYGTTEMGGLHNAGTVFSLVPPKSPGGVWTKRKLHSFAGGSDGGIPESGVVIGAGGVLYGTTIEDNGSAGRGSVFSLTPPTSPGAPWTKTSIYNFSDGISDPVFPYGGLAIGSGGVLYGTTFQGGTADFGTVFSLAPPASAGGPWTATFLYTFKGGLDGALPRAGVSIGPRGVLYGTTSGGGGRSGNGTIFALEPPASPGAPWLEGVLYRFTGGSDGFGPWQNVTLVRSPALYSVTLGGAFGYGTVFSLTP